MAKAKKKKIISTVDNMKHYMKIVGVETCIQCKQQCQRGLDYIEKMSKPGEIGYGVPCILTRGSGMKEKRTGKK